MAGEFRVGFKYKMAIVGDGLSGRLEHRFGAGGCHSPSRRTAPAQSGDHRKRCPTTPTQPNSTLPPSASIPTATANLVTAALDAGAPPQ